MDFRCKFIVLCLHVSNGFFVLSNMISETKYTWPAEYQHNVDGNGFNVICPQMCLCQANEASDIFVDCSNRTLADIPKSIPPETVGLNLSYNGIKALKCCSLAHLTNLQYLDVSRNIIEHLQERCFQGLEHLKFLSLAFNRIRTSDAIPDAIFTPLSNLRELHLHGNCNSATTRNCLYYDTAIATISTLLVLSMDGTQASPLGPGFGKLSHLRTVVFGSGYCWFPYITTKTFQVFGKTEIEHLELKHCHILTIEEDSFSMLTSLVSLVITDSSKLCERGLQNATTGLMKTKIRSLDIKNNCDSGSMKFENGLFLDIGGTNLEFLDMEGCDIEIISIESIEHFPLSLKKLILRDNRLRHPQFLVILPNLKNLEYLDGSLQSSYTTKREQNVTKHSHIIHVTTRTVSGETRGFAINAERDVYNGQKENKVIFKEAIASGYSSGNIPWPNPVPLPPRLKFINGSFLKLAEYPLYGVNFSTKNVIETVDASNNMFAKSNGKVRGLHHIKVLNISGNRLNFIHPETFGDMLSLISLNLHNNDIGRFQVHRDTFENQTNLNQLDLSVNTIDDLPFDIFRSLTNLTCLSLNNNSLSSVKFGLKHLRRLEVLDLSYNQITTIPEITRSEMDHLFEQNSKLAVYITGNDLICDCEHQDTIHWLSSARNHIVDIDTLKCTYMNGTKLSLSLLSDITQDLAMSCMSWQVILGCVITFFGLLLLLSLLAALHHQRWKIKYLYYIGSRNINPYQPLQEDPADLYTDAYISFNEESRGFYNFVTRVFYHELRRRGLTVKIRDEIVAGRNLYEEITEAIKHSKKVIVFLTPGFGEDFWNIFEFNVAALQGIYLQKIKLITVVVGGLTLSDVHPGIKKYVPNDDVIKYNENSLFADFISEIERKML